MTPPYGRKWRWTQKPLDENERGQPSGNLDMCLMFPQGTPGWVKLGLRLAMMQGICSHFDAPNRPWGFEGLERITITLIFFRDFGLLIWLEKKDINSGQGWTSLGPSWLWVEFQPPGFTVRCLCNSQATFEEAKEERVFGQRAVWSKGSGNHMGQDETRVITCFFALSVPWLFYPDNKHMESQSIGSPPGTWCSWW